MRRLFLISILFTLNSCVTTHLDSNKAPYFNEQLDKIYITLDSSNEAEYFVKRLADRIIEDFDSRDIESKAHFQHKLALESSSEVKQKIINFNPNFIMTVTQTERIRSVGGGDFSYGHVTGGSFDIRLFKSDSDKPIWRGNLYAESSVGIEMAARKASIKLINKLIEDGLLEPTEED